MSDEPTVPVEGTPAPASGGGEPAPQGGAPVQPVQPVEPTTSAPEPAQPAQPVQPAQDFRAPGQFSQPEDELAWLRDNYAQAMNNMATMRQQLQDWELAGLTEQERQVEEFRREREAFNNQMKEWRANQDLHEWRGYFGQFTTKQQELATMTDPVQMTHMVIVDMVGELARLQTENEALKKSAAQPATGPVVTTGGASTPNTRSVLTMTREEREAQIRRAKMGLMPDIPG